MTTIQNIWHVRTVAETSSKPCYICHKPTTRVLITPDNKDFFYTCQSHLSDRGFASPIVDAETEAAKKKKEKMNIEIEKVKAEYEEKQKLKKKKKKKTNDKDKDDDGDDEAERDAKIKSIQKEGNVEEEEKDKPRIYALQRHFYQMRIDRLRNIEIEKRNHQRINNPTFFPSAPKGDVS